MTAAFAEEEQEVFLISRESGEKSKAGQNLDVAVEDRLFLLSLDEAARYFENDADRKAPTTAYTLSRNTFNSPELNGWWCLRTPGVQANLAATVNDSGTVYRYGNYVYSIGGDVRPALWIKQSDLQMLP